MQRIRDDYRRAGNAAAAVSYRIVNLPNGTVDVVFETKEGDKTGIKHIVFVGNQAFSSGKLIDLMQTTEMNWLSWFKATDVYDPDRIASDLELIRKFYLKNGYADFRVVVFDAHYDADKAGYTLTITVEEVVEYRVKSVDVDSHLPDILSDSLRGYVRVQRARSQWRYGPKDDRIHDEGTRPPRLSVQPSSSPWRSRPDDTDGEHRLRH